ncbi:hypothetical protein OT_ostta19g00035 [Ostreococcus tauri]|uniref:Uncharacterized protein n=1 Tax=Ostreococcus tauri TaxID=70448 RepID=A0A096PBC0_OSTTA|nr:hypothetical protein OT_ostta19g00035 [Ostreococcus tauri]CEG01901.1 hypothetical protein OT_ostta19g00035 [Ostreococcus tauri]|eukprot:XP_003084287.2 hypothetical protein OT_ostta19g00035 [Ostreococcus tauri]
MSICRICNLYYTSFSHRCVYLCIHGDAHSDYTSNTNQRGRRQPGQRRRVFWELEDVVSQGTLAAFDARACAYRIEYDDDDDDETSFEPSREAGSLVKCRQSHRARLKRRPKRAEVRSFVVRERAECTRACIGTCLSVPR